LELSGRAYPSPGRLPPAPPLAGLFCAVLRAAAQPMMRRRVRVAGLLVTLRRTSNRVGMAQTAGKPTHRVQIVHCATDCAIAIVGFASEGQAPLWKIALAPLLGGAFSCGQPPRRRATDDASAS